MELIPFRERFLYELLYNGHNFAQKMRQNSEIVKVLPYFVYIAHRWTAVRARQMKYMRLSADFSWSMAVRMSSSEMAESAFWIASSSGVGAVELGHLLLGGGGRLFHQGELDGGEDVIRRDLTRRTGQLIAALAALDGIDEASALQQGKDLLEVDLGDAELFRDADDRDRRASGVIAREIRHGSEAIAALSRNLHLYSLVSQIIILKIYVMLVYYIILKMQEKVNPY